MKRILIGISVVTAAAIFSSEAFAKDESWRETMKKLSKALADVVPGLYPDPKLDEKALAEKVAKLAEISWTIDIKAMHSVKYPDDDPALPYVAAMFRDDIARANVSMQEGHADYAKSVLRGSVAYCIACHTRNKPGTQFPMLEAFNESLKRASWIERIEFQAATRQYDVVISEVMGQLKNPSEVGMSSLDLERGARTALSILVRVKKDTDRSAFLAKAVGESPRATVSMKEAAKSWLKDIREWQGEKKKSPDQLAEARRMIKDGKDQEQNAEVRNLRATSSLHDFLATQPSAAQSAEAMLLIGRAYRNLGEIGLWNLHEMYFMGCIDKLPHSPTAESCYRDFADSITLGYSGSSGTHIPKAVRDQLKGLKEKAQVKDVSGG